MINKIRDWLTLRILNRASCVPVAYRFINHPRGVTSGKFYLRSGFMRFISNDEIVIDWKEQTVNLRRYVPSNLGAKKNKEA